MGKYFGTDGFRGEAGITLTADHAYKVGRFPGWYYNALRERNGNNEPARIVIGNLYVRVQFGCWPDRLRSQTPTCCTSLLRLPWPTSLAWMTLIAAS